MSILVKEPQTVNEAFEIIRIGIEKILPLISSHNVENFLIEGDIELKRTSYQRIKDDIEVIKADREKIKLEAAADREKLRMESVRVNKIINDRNSESLELLETVKEFTNEVEKRRLQELMKRTKREPVSA